MPTFHRVRVPKERGRTLKQQPAANETRVFPIQPVYPAGFQLATSDPNFLSPSSVLQLQHIVGNRAVVQLLREQEQPIQRSLEEEEELACPGSMIKSDGQGQGKGYGEGKGPVGLPKDEEWV